ncbi:MAG: hypothetical protein IRZ33_11165 [Alicyclobacillaceae bacterium]|nr:hypothetical protein [Alicyclobacillaceae bacterium]
MKRVLLLFTVLTTLGLSAAAPVAAYAKTSPGVVKQTSGPIGPPTVP